MIDDERYEIYIYEYTASSYRRHLDCPIRVEIIKYLIKILNAFKIRIGRTLKKHALAFCFDHLLQPYR